MEDSFRSLHHVSASPTGVTVRLILYWLSGCNVSNVDATHLNRSSLFLVWELPQRTGQLLSIACTGVRNSDLLPKGKGVPGNVELDLENFRLPLVDYGHRLSVFCRRTKRRA